jgi:hypothetical protein
MVRGLENKIQLRDGERHLESEKIGGKILRGIWKIEGNW